MGFNEAANFVVEKLKEPLAMEDFWAQFLVWFDKVFPRDTREKLHHWLAVALRILIAVLVLITLCFCCYKCCFCCFKGCFRCFTYCFRCFKCCCRGRGHRIGMMKAPGRYCMMPRHIFEASPKSYFSNLRAHPGDLLP